MKHLSVMIREIMCLQWIKLQIDNALMTINDKTKKILRKTHSKTLSYMYNKPISTTLLD